MKRFPKWAPPYLVDKYHRLARKKSPPTPTLDLLDRLLKTPGMEKVWKSIERHSRARYKTLPDWVREGLSIDRSIVASQNDFFHRVYMASRGPYRFDTLTIADAEKKARRVGQAAGELVTALKDIGLDWLSINTIRDRTLACIEQQHSSRESWRIEEARAFFQPPTDGDLFVTDLCAGIAAEVAEHAQRPRVLSRPNAANADVHYFVRQLADYLKEQYGRQLLEVIAATTNAVFDASLDPSHVSKLIPKV